MSNNTPLTAAELDELERLEAAATPGEWQRLLSERTIYSVADPDDWDPIATDVYATDAALIAAARNALPTLLAMARNYVFEMTHQSNVEKINEKCISDIDRVCAERDRYLAALKAEALTRAQVAANRAVRDWYEFRSGDYCIGGITFRVTRNDDGELVAEEVIE